ncbi:MAG: DUF4093 domain-containing protein [Oscillospiraceae bacterium]|nr:DUF4093 domain-containing protein [Oscillospiraceae bacterium]
MKRRVREIIVVEGRYDRNTVSQAVDCTVIETSGFGIFSDAEKVSLLRRLAEKRGVIILTDPDGAGFLIRGHLKGMLNGSEIKHAYVPEITGREKRKKTDSKARMLGVEGMSPSVIINALERAGATFDDDSLSERSSSPPVSKADMFELGLSGGPGSSEKRAELARRLELPAAMSANALLDVINSLYTRDEFISLFQRIFDK